MEGSNNYNDSTVIAPFVLKTYQMVSDSATDGLIIWGRANNSFIVIQPLDFSLKILPAYFKHNNFSSFVRQLNTYGFRKVDPDSWEFANEWFLRGQIQLLGNIVRRKRSRGTNAGILPKHESIDEEEDTMLKEISRLKEEQKSLDEELVNMGKRLEETERRPQQMMSFLYKVIEDPNVLPRLLMEKEMNRRMVICRCEKKRKLMISSSSSSPPSSSDNMAISCSSFKSGDEHEKFDVGLFCPTSPSPDTPSELLSQREVMGPPIVITQELPSSAGSGLSFSGASCFTVAPPDFGGGDWRDGTGSGGVKIGFHGRDWNEEDARRPPPYPFSLFGGGF